MWDWVDDLLGEGGTQPQKVSEDTCAARRPSLLVQGGGQGGGGSSGLWDFLGDDATSSDEVCAEAKGTFSCGLLVISSATKKKVH